MLHQVNYIKCNIYHSFTHNHTSTTFLLVQEQRAGTEVETFMPTNLYTVCNVPDINMVFLYLTLNINGQQLAVYILSAITTCVQHTYNLYESTFQLHYRNLHFPRLSLLRFFIRRVMHYSTRSRFLYSRNGRFILILCILCSHRAITFRRLAALSFFSFIARFFR